MFRCLALFACLIVASPLAAEPRHVTGEIDGVSFDYTAHLQHDGEMVLRGTYLKTGEQFEFTVSTRGHVDGFVGSNPVAFDVPQKVHDEAVASVRLNDNAELADIAIMH